MLSYEQCLHVDRFLTLSFTAHKLVPLKTSRAWGDGAVGGALAVEASGPEFES